MSKNNPKGASAPEATFAQTSTEQSAFARKLEKAARLEADDPEDGPALASALRREASTLFGDYVKSVLESIFQTPVATDFVELLDTLPPEMEISLTVLFKRKKDQDGNLLPAVPRLTLTKATLMNGPPEPISTKAGESHAALSESEKTALFDLIRDTEPSEFSYRKVCLMLADLRQDPSILKDVSNSGFRYLKSIGMSNQQARLAWRSKQQ